MICWTSLKSGEIGGQSMKRIKYPPRGSQEFDNLKAAYKAIYSVAELNSMQEDWDNWKTRYYVTNINETVEQLMLYDVAELADIYDRFTHLTQVCEKESNKNGDQVRSKAYHELDAIFKYHRHYDKRIANFFRNHADKLSICSCHYCELAYINAYQVLVGKKAEKHQHFDLDHFFPKTHCPILGLSLFNFVPSCQVCNSRIKSSHEVATNTDDWVKFSPVSESYGFEDNVKIHLRMQQGPDTTFEKKGEYYIYFRCDDGFRTLVDFFHLEERYEFHKLEAMRIKKLKAKYPQSARRKIARLLGTSESMVKEDLFHENYLKNNDRCFAKLTSDMLQ